MLIETLIERFLEREAGRYKQEIADHHPDCVDCIYNAKFKPPGKYIEFVPGCTRMLLRKHMIDRENPCPGRDEYLQPGYRKPRC